MYIYIYVCVIEKEMGDLEGGIYSLFFDIAAKVRLSIT